jgi:hypothetical protein
LSMNVCIRIRAGRWELQTILVANWRISIHFGL